MCNLLCYMEQNFYLIGRDVERRHWRVLKIGRCKPSALVIHEDPTIYTRKACKLLLRSIDEGNKSTGGLKFVTDSYGIIGRLTLLININIKYPIMSYKLVCFQILVQVSSKYWNLTISFW